MALLCRRLWTLTCFIAALASYLDLVSASQPLELYTETSGNHNNRLSSSLLRSDPLQLRAESQDTKLNDAMIQSNSVQSTTGSPFINSTRWKCDPREIMILGDRIQPSSSTESIPLQYVIKRCCTGFLSGNTEKGPWTQRRVQAIKMCLGLLELEARKFHSENIGLSQLLDEIDLNSLMESEYSSIGTNFTVSNVTNINIEQNLKLSSEHSESDDSKSIPKMPTMTRGTKSEQPASNQSFFEIFASKVSHALSIRMKLLFNPPSHEPARRFLRIVRSAPAVSSFDMFKEILSWLAPSEQSSAPVRAERRMLDLGNDPQDGGRYEECKLIRNSTDCGLAPIKKKHHRVKRIINGYRSREHEWPWVVSLYTIPEPSFWFIFFKSLSCGGVLLTQQIVLSCAHCFHSVRYTMSPNKIKVVAGTNSYFDEPFTMKVKRLMIHPEFDPDTFSHDLSLLLLERPLEYQVNIQPVCLPPPMKIDLVGKMGTVLGWGYTSTKGPPSHWLHETDVRILSSAQCESLYAKTAYAFDLPRGSFCAGFEDGRTDACEGDSGGPLLVQDDCGIWKVAGVVSNGYSCAQPNQPGIYTDVIFHRAWITDNIDRLEKVASFENKFRQEEEQKSSRSSVTAEGKLVRSGMNATKQEEPVR